MPPFLAVPINLPIQAPIVHEMQIDASTTPEVPFFSQFDDIDSALWKKRSCGVVSLGMIIEYFSGKTLDLNSLLQKGIDEGAFIANVGWSHRGLADLSTDFGLHGTAYDLSDKKNTEAFTRFKAILEDGPVIVSAHYKFDPKSTIPHLLVINKIIDDTVYYNDPAATEAYKKISVSDFMNGWKKRFIVVRPNEET